KMRALILVPTRELAQQVATAIERFEKYLPVRRGVAVIIGGEEIDNQLRLLRRGVDIVVATPGRLLVLIDNRWIQFNDLHILVIDEADRLLALGFAEELDQILAALPSQRQSLLFSATYPKKVMQLTEKVMQNPSYINVSGDVPTVAHITQRAIEVNHVNRGPLLRHLLQTEKWEHILLFVSNKRAAHNLAQKLRRDGIQADAFHGDLSQDERTYVLNQFKKRNIRILIATDLAARGIDIQNLSHVVNYDLPRSPVDYIHRIGRTGRAGAQGVSVTFIDHSDQAHFSLIEKRTKVQVRREQIPGYELTGEAPVKTKGAQPVKGKRPSKKDKARALAAAQQKQAENE
ncbi:MAG: DEAD/DEAH box helicase, partial [Kiritimatiellaceae bacterium]|nr:DEAD/DEAH box helicase [Kiritimatiellaceae bacterium]